MKDGKSWHTLICRRILTIWIGEKFINLVSEVFTAALGSYKRSAKAEEYPAPSPQQNNTGAVRPLEVEHNPSKGPKDKVSRKVEGISNGITAIRTALDELEWSYRSAKLGT
jgi:hypothetical protein